MLFQPQTIVLLWELFVLNKKQHMETTLLFDSVYSAQEVGFTLSASWDGCNAVTFTDFDELDVSFQIVVGIASAEYCHVGQKCLIQDVESHSNSPTSSMSFGRSPSKVGCKVTSVSQAPNLIDKELLEAFTKRMSLAYLIYPNLFNTPKLLAPASEFANEPPAKI